MSTHILSAGDRHENINFAIDEEILDETGIFVGHKLMSLKAVGRNYLADAARRDQTKAEV